MVRGLQSSRDVEASADFGIKRDRQPCTLSGILLTRAQVLYKSADLVGPVFLIT